MLKRTTLLFVVALVVLAATVALPSTALTHASYGRSVPTHGEVLLAAPIQIDIWFSHELFQRAGANTIGIDYEDGRRVFAGEGTIDPLDRTHMMVGLPVTLPKGEYTVRWKSLSRAD